jgi:alpha-acetolactate decarboxylase
VRAVRQHHPRRRADDRDAGGHLLDCVISNATVEIGYIGKYFLFL